mmetsp:Transcript_11469/g.22215  ORF Transcript_11469/g.22215 Transcript_11469/m.22215 type:complete len:167 (+) Transcript_11469:604-1104(+)
MTFHTRRRKHAALTTATISKRSNAVESQSVSPDRPQTRHRATAPAHIELVRVSHGSGGEYHEYAISSSHGSNDRPKAPTAKTVCRAAIDWYRRRIARFSQMPKNVCFSVAGMLMKKQGYNELEPNPETSFEDDTIPQHSQSHYTIPRDSTKSMQNDLDLQHQPVPR